MSIHRARRALVACAVLAALLAVNSPELAIAAPKPGSACKSAGSGFGGNGQSLKCVFVNKKGLVWTVLPATSPTSASAYPSGFSGITGVDSNYAYKDVSKQQRCNAAQGGVCVTLDIFSRTSCSNNVIVIDFKTSRTGSLLDTQQGHFNILANNTSRVQVTSLASNATWYFIKSVFCNSSSGPVTTPDPLSTSVIQGNGQSTSPQPTSYTNQIMYSFPTNIIGAIYLSHPFTLYSTHGDPVNADGLMGFPDICQFHYGSHVISASRSGHCHIDLQSPGAEEVLIDLYVISDLNMSSAEIADRSARCFLITNLPAPQNCSAAPAAPIHQLSPTTPTPTPQAIGASTTQNTCWWIGQSFSFNFNQDSKPSGCVNNGESIPISFCSSHSGNGVLVNAWQYVPFTTAEINQGAIVNQLYIKPNTPDGFAGVVGQGFGDFDDPTFFENSFPAIGSDNLNHEYFTTDIYWRAQGSRDANSSQCDSGLDLIKIDLPPTLLTENLPVRLLNASTQPYNLLNKSPDFEVDMNWRLSHTNLHFPERIYNPDNKIANSADFIVNWQGSEWTSALMVHAHSVLRTCTTTNVCTFKLV